MLLYTLTEFHNIWGYSSLEMIAHLESFELISDDALESLSYQRLPGSSFQHSSDEEVDVLHISVDVLQIVRILVMKNIEMFS